MKKYELARLPEGYEWVLKPREEDYFGDTICLREIKTGEVHDFFYPAYYDLDPKKIARRTKDMAKSFYRKKKFKDTGEYPGALTGYTTVYRKI